MVLSVNYRLGVGTAREFQHPARAACGGRQEYQDVVAGAGTSPPTLVDPKRIGIWGGSYGGFLTAMALAKNSELFAAGVDRTGSTNGHGMRAEQYCRPSGVTSGVMRTALAVAWCASPGRLHEELAFARVAHPGR